MEIVLNPTTALGTRSAPTSHWVGRALTGLALTPDGRMLYVASPSMGKIFELRLAPNGTLIYVGYTSAGYDLFSVPFDSSGVLLVLFKAEATRAGPNRTNPADRENPATPEDHPYSPRRTLMPTSWTPVIEVDANEIVVGAATAMVDALGRHAYGVDAGWTRSRARPDWHAAYAYDRWRPTLFASYSDETDPVQGGLVRSRELFAGMLLPFRHIRWTETLLAGVGVETTTLSCRTEIRSTCPARNVDRDLRSLRGGWLHDSRRTFGYSISTEEGFAVQAAAETSRTLLGSDVNAGAAVFDARAYHRLGHTHLVLAGRVAVADSWGPAGIRRRFSAAGPGAGAPVFDLGRDSVGLLRGVAPDDVVGARAAVTNLDLRVPLARVQRGVGSWPVFVRAIHAAAFVDAGHAWDTTFRAAGVHTSAGGELSLDVVLGHFVPLTLVGGAAWTRDGVAGRSRATFFGRVGHAF